MNLQQSYPPADALIGFLSGVDYRKHLNSYMDFVEKMVLIVAAFVYVAWQRGSNWYHNGGKESLVNSYIQVRNFVQFVILWVREVGYPETRKFVQDSVEYFRAWQDLVTV